ncbi:MAG: trimethylamine methyltransferase [Chloroflexi bacterium]|nr:MAG: trimethylamine methyltransferase [Chloroflexota bacterium]
MPAPSKPAAIGGRPGPWRTPAHNRMWKNTLKPYDILDKEQVQQIHAHAMLILQEIGVDFLHPKAIDTFRRAGLRIEENRVHFEPAFVEEQIKKVPATFQVQARNPKNTVTIGGDHMVNAPVYGPPFITDLDRGRRGATIEDFTNFDKMAQATPQIHCAGGTIVEPEDLPLETRHLDMVYSHIRWTDMTFMGSVISEENARDSIEMASIVFGGRAEIEKTPALLALVNVNSPLRYDDRMLGSLLEYAAANQPVIATPFLMAGAMSPMGLAGTLAQQTAEALAGIALIQLVRPGAPCIYGSFLTNIDMQSGSPAFGTPESAMGILASAQMARHYRIPFRGGGALTSSKSPDAQAAYESRRRLAGERAAGVLREIHHRRGGPANVRMDPGQGDPFRRRGVRHGWDPRGRARRSPPRLRAHDAALPHGLLPAVDLLDRELRPLATHGLADRRPGRQREMEAAPQGLRRPGDRFGG